MEKEAVQKLFRVTDRSSIMDKRAYLASKRGYRCQRCRNHNLDVARKGHVDQCPYRACRCSQCVLVERRTDTHRLLKQKAVMNNNNIFERKPSSGNEHVGDEKGEPMTLVSALTAAVRTPQDRKSNSDGNRHKHEKRILRCAKCSNHDVHAPLKNHKQTCPYRHCLCSMCHLVDDYRNILKDQIKTRRMQSRQKTHFQTVDQPARLHFSKSHQNRMAIQNGSISSINSVQKSKSSAPIRKSVIVSSSPVCSSTMSETESIKTPPITPTFGASLDEKANNVLWLGHLAALSTLWQHRGVHQIGLPLPLMPAYDFYNALSTGLNLQMS